MVILAWKLESFLILVQEAVAFLLASIYRGFLVRMRFHPRLVNPPHLRGNPRSPCLVRPQKVGIASVKDVSPAEAEEVNYRLYKLQ